MLHALLIIAPIGLQLELLIGNVQFHGLVPSATVVKITFREFSLKIISRHQVSLQFKLALLNNDT
jgi:hypothetical protein